MHANAGDGLEARMGDTIQFIAWPDGMWLIAKRLGGGVGFFLAPRFSNVNTRPRR